MRGGTSAVSARLRESFVGRRTEIDALTDVLVRAGNGEGTTVLVTGDAGIGKSALLRWLVTEAGRRGFVSFLGEATELEQRRILGALVDAFGLRASATDDGTPRIVEDIHSAGTVDPAPAVGFAPFFRVADELLGLVEARAASAPVLLAIDDIQWADAATLLALQLIARRANSLSLVLACTARPLPRNSDLEAFLRRLRPGALELALEGLEPGEAADIAREALGTDPGPALLELLERAAGNPLFIGTLLSALAREGLIREQHGVVDSLGGVIPPTLGLTILQQLSFLSAGSLELLRSAAVLGNRFSASELAAAMGKTVIDLVSLLSEVRDAGLVDVAADELSFRHDLVRDAVYQDMPASVRRGLHRETAARLERAGASPVRIATHYMIGADVGDQAAAGYLHRTADNLLRVDPPSAVAFVQRAVELSAGGARNSSKVTTLVRALAAAGRFDEAAAAGMTLLHRGPGAGMSLIRLVARCLGSIHRWTKAAEVLEAAAASKSRPGDRRRLLAEAAYWRAWAAPADAREVAEHRREEALGAGDESALSWTTIALARVLAYVDGDFARAGELVTGLDLPAIEARVARGELDDAALDIVGHLLHLDRTQEAERFLDSVALGLAATRQAWPGVVEGLRALGRFESGSWDAAVVLLDTALEAAFESDRRTNLGVIISARCVIATHRGDVDVVRQCIERVAGFEFWKPTELWHRALLHDLEGDRAGLSQTLDQALPVLLSHPLGRLLLFNAARDFTRLFVHIGDTSSAHVIAEQAHRLARSSGMPWAWASAHACAGLASADVALLVQSVADGRRSPRALPLAESLEWAGTAFARHGDREQAVVHLAESLDLYDALGATRDISRVEALLRSLGERSRPGRSSRRPSTGWESLTDRELDVALLVSEGLSYREIGERLFVSRRTVETHVSHIFNKLGIRTRAALADEVRQHA